MHRTAILLLLASAACGKLEFNPPASPPHVVNNDGALHAPRLYVPFGCGGVGKPDDDNQAPCPPTRPEDRLLSCDAYGCHGGFTFEPGSPRHLRGSEGPSCFTCHDDKWNDEDEDEEDD